MKTIRIQLDPVEEAMLIEVQKVNHDYRDLKKIVSDQIRQGYAKISKKNRS
jgi:hypothetical protein